MRFAQTQRPQWTPRRAETTVCWTACEPRTRNERLTARTRRADPGPHAICAEGADGRGRTQIRRTVVREDVLRRPAAGGPCRDVMVASAFGINGYVRTGDDCGTNAARKSRAGLLAVSA